MAQRKSCKKKWIEDEKIGWFVINALRECLSSYQRSNIIFAAVSVTHVLLCYFSFHISISWSEYLRQRKNSPHNFRSLGLCSLLKVDAVAVPFFQYVNCSTKNKSPYIREKARSAVVIATDANAIWRQCGRDREKRRWMKMCWPIGMSLSVQQSFHSWKRLSAQHITDFLFFARNLFRFYVRSHSLLHEKNSVRRKMFPSSFDSVVAYMYARIINLYRLSVCDLRFGISGRVQIVRCARSDDKCGHSKVKRSNR